MSDTPDDIELVIKKFERLKTAKLKRDQEGQK